MLISSVTIVHESLNLATWSPAEYGTPHAQATVTYNPSPKAPGRRTTARQAKTKSQGTPQLKMDTNKNTMPGPWPVLQRIRCSAWGTTQCQCRGHGFNPWSGKIPHAVGQLSSCATITEPPGPQLLKPERLKPVLHNKKSHLKEKLEHYS